MGVPVRTTALMGIDNLSEKAAKMRESLQKSQLITDNMVSILGSFDHRLSALETAMRPTQVFFFFYLGQCPLVLIVVGFEQSWEIYGDL